MEEATYILNKSIKIEPSDAAIVDSFSRWRVSSPVTLFDSKQVHDDQTLFINNVPTGGATFIYDNNKAETRMNLTTASGDKAVRQTREYFNYQPGKSQLILMTGVLGAKKVGVRQRIGYFDNDNGIFFEQDENNLKVVLRSKVTGVPDDSRFVIQSNWNLDKMDGNGPTGINIDTSKTLIFFIDFEWLGVGRVRMGFVIGGKVVYCHEFLNSNLQTEVYMSTANLPARYEIENLAITASPTTMQSICMSINSEGGFNPRFIRLSGNRGITPKIVNSSREIIYAIRLEASHIRVPVIPLGFDLLVTSNDNVLWEIVINPTLNGVPTWNPVDALSGIEESVDATTFTGGHVIGSGYTEAAAAGKDIESAVKLVSDFVGTQTVLALVISNLQPNASCLGGFTWRELL